MSRFQSFIFFEKVNKGNLKIVNFNYEKRPDLAVILIKDMFF